MNTYKVRDGLKEERVKELEQYPCLVQKLLVSRDIYTAEAAEKFLNPQYDELIHDPFLMLNMDKAVSRVLSAIKKDEHIVIYSDYDCDGIPGGVVLHDFFKKIGYQHFSNYIPHRHEEGYGLNISAIEKVAEAGAKLMITVDCGITDVKPVDRANELGLDVIITDHHLQNGELPKAYTVINPNQDADTTYPCTGLCGAGVAFKLVQGLIQKGDFNLVEGWEKWLLDMVGLATVADMMPLMGENRALAYYGLHVLRKSRRPGLQQLMQKMKMQQRHITEDDIGFMIAPRVNAASRMDRPEDAFRLLATNDVVEGGTLSTHLDTLNSERKGLVAAMSREINRRIKEMEEIPPVIVMGNPDWKPALLGLAANPITEEHKRPVFLWGRADTDTYKGSCRSDGSVNLVTLMDSVRDTFIDAGGHAFSGGYSVKSEKIHEFEQIMNDAYEQLPTNNVDHTILVDERLSIDDVTWSFYKHIEQFAPFGEGNPKPLFLFENTVIKDVQHFGKEKNHLKILFENFNEGVVNAIAFFKTVDDYDVELAPGATINLVAHVEKSMFLNKPELRLRIVDIYT